VTGSSGIIQLSAIRTKFSAEFYLTIIYYGLSKSCSLELDFGIFIPLSFLGVFGVGII